MGTPIVALQAEFFTSRVDKADDDGISETFVNGAAILGSNVSWGQRLTFHEDSHNLGERFEVSRFGVTTDDIPHMIYKYLMDTDRGWHVRIVIKAYLSDGNVWEVANEDRTIGSHKPAFGGDWFDSPRDGQIQLRVPRG